MGFVAGIFLMLAGFWIFQMAWHEWSDSENHDEYGVSRAVRQRFFALVTFLISLALMFAGWWLVL